MAIKLHRHKYVVQHKILNNKYCGTLCKAVILCRKRINAGKIKIIVYVNNLMLNKYLLKL